MRWALSKSMSERGLLMSEAAAGAAAAMAMGAPKAQGVVVRLEPLQFMLILQRQPGPIVVRATRGFIHNIFQYLTTYKGLTFYTEARDPIVIPDDADLLDAKSISVPYV